MKLSGLLVVENPETSCTGRIHWILCCPLVVSYRSRIRTGHRQGGMLALQRGGRHALVCITVARDWQEHLIQESRLLWHSRSWSHCTESFMSCHSSEQQVVACLLSVGQKHSLLSLLSNSSTLSISDMLLVDPLSPHVASSVWGGWMNVCRCIQPQQVDWQWVSSRGQPAVGGSEVMGLGVILTAPYNKKVSRSLYSRAGASWVLRGKHFLKSKVYNCTLF